MTRRPDCRIIAGFAHAEEYPRPNAVDRPEICDFYTPALVNRAPVAIAIRHRRRGTGSGADDSAPASTAMLSPSLGALASLAASYRIAAEKLLPRGSARRRFWREFFAGSPARAMEVGHISEARRAATRLLRNPGPWRGSCRAGRCRAPPPPPPPPPSPPPPPPLAPKILLTLRAPPPADAGRCHRS